MHIYDVTVRYYTLRDESPTDAATAIYFICILLQLFGFDLTFCSGSCGRIHVRSRPRALLKIDESEIHHSKSVGSSTRCAYDPVSGCLCAVHHACSCASSWSHGGLSVGHVLFLTIRQHPSEKERERETGPVQRNYRNHFEDSVKERRKKSGTQQQAVGTNTQTVQYDHCLCSAG